MTRILVTGGTGFIGRALCPVLLKAGFEVSLASRSPREAEKIKGVDIRPIPSLSGGTDWSGALRGVDAVVHLAARAHIMDDPASDPLAEFRRVNTEGARRLAQDASAAGVARLVFLSTIKVNGESTPPDRPFRADDEANPADPYALSKWEAEQAVREISQASGMDAVIIRPPLVYGPRVRGNFLTLLEKCAGSPVLPLGSIRNRRSLIYVGNLADVILRSLVTPEAAGRTFLASDDENLSTPDLIRRTSKALGRRSLLLPSPPWLLRMAGSMVGRRAAVSRLLDSLVVDDADMRDILDWTPPHTVDEGLAATATWFNSREHGIR